MHKHFKGQTERQRYAQRKCKDKSAKVDCFGRCKDRVQRGMQIQSRKRQMQNAQRKVGTECKDSHTVKEIKQRSKKDA